LESEQVLGMTGVVDEKMAAKAGKILGVDALILGKVTPHPEHANLAVSYRVVRTETGEILEARQVAAGNPDGRGARRSYRTESGEVAEPRSKLMQAVVFKVAAGIQPHAVKVEREFENGGWLFGDSEIQQGIEYLKANRPQDAVSQWETIVKREPGNSAAWYNLGIAYELLYEFDKAEQAFRAAERITPKTRYIEAVGHARVAAESHRKLEEEK
jgi:tetratricopeptide (TPR) repeat protein